jgi:hypothetical protein
MEPNLGVLKSRPPLGKRRIHSDGYTSATTDERFGIGKRFTDSSIAVHFDCPKKYRWGYSDQDSQTSRDMEFATLAAA